MKFLSFWIASYEKSRAENLAMVDLFSARIAAEFAIATEAVAEPAQVPVRGWLSGAGRVSAGLVLREFWIQLQVLRTFLKQVRRRGDRGNLLVVSDTRRLAPWPTPAALLESLRPLAETAGSQAFNRRIGSAPALLIFSPNLFVGDAQKNGAAVIGYLGVVSLLVLAPVQSVRHILRCMPGAFNRKLLFWAVLTGLIDTLLNRAKIGDTMLTTSNSYAVELVRWRAVMRAEGGASIEIMHGVPTREFTDYLTAITGLISDNTNRSRMIFIPTVPEVRVPDVSGMVEPVDFAINAKLSAFAAANDRQAVLARATRAGGRYRVAINGGAAYPAYYFDTLLYRVECEMVREVRGFAVAKGIDIEILYTVHPAHLKSGVADEFAQRIDADLLAHNSVESWLNSDLCVSLLSSSIWEARYLGTPTFIAVSEQDNLYVPELLAGGWHIVAGQTTLTCLRSALEAMTEQPPADADTVAQRVDKMFDMKSGQDHSDGTPSSVGGHDGAATAVAVKD